MNYYQPRGCPGIFPQPCCIGPTGSQGPPGPNWLWENNLFVDSVYGKPLGTAQRNNPGSPYLTIADALTESLPGDNIYVRTGNHTGFNLDLTERNLYLQSATVLNNTAGTSLFIGSNFNIYGDGTIVINSGSAFNISGKNYIELIRLTTSSDETVATITDETTMFIKDLFQNTSPTATSFNLSGSKHNFTITNFIINGGIGFNIIVSSFDLNIGDITQTGTGTIFVQSGTAGQSFFRLEFDSMSNTGSTWQGSNNATAIFNGNDIVTNSTLSTPLFLVNDQSVTLVMEMKAILGFTSTAGFFEIHGQLFINFIALISGSPTNPIFLLEDTAATVRIEGFAVQAGGGAPVLRDLSNEAGVMYKVVNSDATNTASSCYEKNSNRGNHFIEGSFNFSTNDASIPAMSLTSVNLTQCFLAIDNFDNSGPGISLSVVNCELSGSINRINSNSNAVCSFQLPFGNINLQIDETFQNSPSILPALILAGGRYNLTMSTTKSVLVDGSVSGTEVLLSTKRWENNGNNNATQLTLIGDSLIEADVELWNNFDSGANSVQMVNLNTSNTANPCVLNISRFISNSTPANNNPLISVTSGRLYLSGGDFQYYGQAFVANVSNNSVLVFDFLTQQISPPVVQNQFVIDNARLVLSGQSINGSSGGGLVVLSNGATGTVDYQTLNYSTSSPNSIFNITDSSLTVSITDLTNNGDGDVFFISGNSSILVNSEDMANSTGRLFFLSGNSTIEANYNRGDATGSVVAIELDSTFTGSFSHYCNYLNATTNCILIDAGASPNFMNISGRYVSTSTHVIDNLANINFGLRADNTILVAGNGAASINSLTPLTVYCGGVLTTNDPLSPPANVTPVPATNFASDPTFQ
jgi:hypothetical protein